MTSGERRTRRASGSRVRVAGILNLVVALAPPATAAAADPLPVAPGSTTTTPTTPAVAQVGRPAGRCLILLAALAAAGCLPAARPEPLVPTVAGVVAEVEQLEGRGRTFAYRLETGAVVEIDHESALIVGAPSGPGEGSLLLSGVNRSGRTWLIGLPLNPVVESHPDCFRLIATGIGVDGWIDMSNGLRLKKAADFDPGTTKDERYATERFAFCVNSRGEVTSYGI